MGTWAAYSAFKQIVETSLKDGEITAETFSAALPTAKVDLPGMLPPIDFSKPWNEDGGPKGYDRLFNRCVIFSKIEGGKVVPDTTTFEDVSELAGGKNPQNCG
jgi:hypothetical protein